MRREAARVFFAIGDRITVMRDGQRVHTGPARGLDKAALIKLIVGRPLEALFAHSPHPAGAVALELKGLGRAGAFRSPRDAMRLGLAYVPEERRSQGLVLEFPTAWNISLASLPQLSRRG